MVFAYNSYRRPVMLKVTVQTLKPTVVRIIVKDSERPNTYYLNRFNEISGTDSFYVRMPESPQRTVIKLINDKTGKDDGFKLLKTEALPLKTAMDIVDFKDDNIKSFIKFAKSFASRAGYISPGIYLSDDGKFQITYNAAIMNKSGLKELNTPARINSVSGKVEVSQRQFINYTVAGRFAILLHEFSHVFANKDVKDEIEADFHAAQIYLALGYPRIELLNVFGKVFFGADTDMNRKRFDIMTKYVMSFDNNISKVKYL